MRVLMVYEGFFGNTAQVAGSVATGIRSSGPTPAAHEVAVLQSHAAPAVLDGVDLMIVGAATHLLTISSPFSRWLQAQTWGDPRAPHRSHRPHDARVTRPACVTG